jgi:maleate isomerase
MTDYRIGMLTPSANTCLEPVTYGILADVPEVSVHFSRLRVTHTGLSAEARAQFALENFIAAAKLLADAEVDVLAWNGSSGSWLGAEFEDTLCEEVEAATGIRMITTTNALFDAMMESGVKSYGLVAPYPDDMMTAITGTYEARGFPCDRSVALALTTTLEKDRVPPDTIRQLIRDCYRPEQDGIAVVCTNFRGAPLVDSLERELDTTIIDSVSATVWKCLQILGIRPEIEGWGKLLRGGTPSAAGESGGVL